VERVVLRSPHYPVDRVGQSTEGRNHGNTRTEIERELAVCEDHHRMLAGGLYTLDQLVAMYQPAKVPTPQVTVNRAVPLGKPVKVSKPGDTQRVNVEVMYRIEGDPVG
jgi:hypothetical protein